MHYQCANLGKSSQTAKYFSLKSHDYVLFCDFLAKNLQEWKKSSTFAAAFEKSGAETHKINIAEWSSW